jgi:hypothetical protein
VRRLSKRLGYTSSRPRKRDRNSAIFSAAGESLWTMRGRASPFGSAASVRLGSSPAVPLMCESEATKPSRGKRIALRNGDDRVVDGSLRLRQRPSSRHARAMRTPTGVRMNPSHRWCLSGVASVAGEGRFSSFALGANPTKSHGGSPLKQWCCPKKPCQPHGGRAVPKSARAMKELLKARVGIGRLSR